VSDINSNVTLDASQAIGEMGRLSRATTQANAALENFRINANGEIEGVFEGAAAAAERLQRGTEAVGRSTEVAGRGAQRLLLSWESISRIVQTQVLYRAVTALKQGFFDSADAAQKFELSLGRINAIANQSETNFDDLDARIKKLSTTIGRDLSETSKAVFEALQNDLGTTDQTFELLEGQAASLAKVTGGTLTDAVNVLSSVIKVYGEDSNDAATAAGTLFGAINAGRVTLDDLARGMGTVIPLGEQLGLSFEQSMNAVATASLAGIDSATAMTQLRNVFNKLIKPTDEMRKVFTRLRVEGFKELAERTGGDLTAALQLITDEVGGNETAIAKLFNTIRGNLGVVNILAQDGKLAANTMDIMRESAEGLADKVADINALDATAAQVNAAKMEVVFTEIGASALKMRNRATEAFLAVIDDSASAETALISLGGAATIAGGAFLTMQVRAAAAAASAGTAATAFSTLFPPLAAFTAGVAGGLFISNQIDSWRESTAKLNDEMAKLRVKELEVLIQKTNQINSDKIKELNAAFENTNTILNKTIEASRNASSSLIDDFNETSSQIKARGSDLLESFADGRERILDRIKSTIKGIDGEILSLTKQILSEQRKLDDSNFKKSLDGLSDMQKANKALAHSYNEIEAASKAVSSAGLSEESRNAALATVDAAEAAARYSLELAKTSKNVFLVEKAEEQLQRIREGRIESLMGFQDQLEAQNKNYHEKEHKRLEFLNEEQKLAVKDQLDGLTELEEKAAKGLIDPKVFAIEAGKVRAEIKRIEESFGEFSDSPLLKALDIDELAKQVEQRFSEGMANVRIDWTSAVNQLQSDLSGARFEATVDLISRIDGGANAELTERFKDISNVNPTEQLEERARIIKEYVVETAKADAQAAASSLEITKAITEGQAQLKEAVNNATFGHQRTAIKELMGEASAGITEISSMTEAQAQSYRSKLIGIYNELKTVQGDMFNRNSTFGFGNAEKLLDVIKHQLDATETQIEVIGTKPLLGAEPKMDLQNLTDFINGNDSNKVILDVDSSEVKQAKIEVDGITVSADAATASTSRIGEAAMSSESSMSSLNSATNALTGSANAASQAYWAMAAAAAAAAAAAQQAAAAGGQGYAYNGGLQYMANGGKSRGQDTQATMLAPGEFVANQRATANFLPQLQAINAGNKPGGGGGGNTNITIGDINVTSQSQLPSQTAREVGLSIKRELRRGTMKL